MRLAAIMMHKDEVGLLPQWLVYYSALCGDPRHLYIFDDHSDEPSVLDALREAARAGVNLTRCGVATKGIDEKGRLVSETIRSLGDRYDVYLTPDCDEFICVDSGEGPIIDAAQVLSAIGTAISHSNAALFRLDGSFVNIPATTRLQRHPQKKIMVRSLPPGFTLDNGFHVPEHMVKPGVIASTNLSYIHCHYKPFRLLQRSARDKLAPYISDFSRDALLAFKGENFHVAQHLLMTEDHYRRLFKLVAFIEPNEAVRNLLASVNKGWAQSESWLGRVRTKLRRLGRKVWTPVPVSPVELR
jgi:hypothetical protein